jgi:uncharacterized protein YneR
MKVQITNKQLFDFHNELMMWEGNSILFYFLNGRLREFRNQNNIRIQHCAEKYQKILSDHYVMENGNIKMKQGFLVGEENKQTPELTGKTTQEEFQKIEQEFFNQIVTVEL